MLLSIKLELFEKSCCLNLKFFFVPIFVAVIFFRKLLGETMYKYINKLIHMFIGRKT